MVFDRAPARLRRLRGAERARIRGCAVRSAAQGSVAVGAWLLIEFEALRPSKVAERSVVLFLLTSAINLITLALAGMGLWLGVLPGKHDVWLSLVPGGVGVVVFVGFLMLPWVAERFIVGHFHGRLATWTCATSGTIRDTARTLFSPDWRLLGAVGYLWFDIAVLWVCLVAAGPGHHRSPTSSSPTRSATSRT